MRCQFCGSERLQRVGMCWVCLDCGETTGCGCSQLSFDFMEN